MPSAGRHQAQERARWAHEAALADFQMQAPAAATEAQVGFADMAGA